jgi:hypothetical protein
MFGLFKKKVGKDGPRGPVQSYRFGGQVGDQMAAAIDEYLDRRLPIITKNVLKLFAERLDTIYCEPDFDPKTVAAIELSILRKHRRFAGTTEE